MMIFIRVGVRIGQLQPQRQKQIPFGFAQGRLFEDDN